MPPVRIPLGLTLMLLVPFPLSGCREELVRAPVNGTPAAAATRPGVFEDATQRLGIDFQHTNGKELNFPLIQTAGGGCAFLDVDGDGWQDVLLLSCGDLAPDGRSFGARLALYRNDRGARFIDISESSGLNVEGQYAQGLAVGDYDNDGRRDVFVAGYPECRLFRNQGGQPIFADITKAAGVAGTDQGLRWSTGAVWGDYDSDGRLDLFVHRYTRWTPELDRWCKRADGERTFCNPAMFEGDSPRFYRNQGAGRFRDVSASAGISHLRARTFSAAWIDFDSDGRLDLAVANDGSPNWLFRNLGGGRFAEVGAEAGIAYGADGAAAAGMGIASGDYDNSGRESILITNLNGELFSLFRNQGGRFSYATDHAGLRHLTIAYSAWGAAFLDYDHDGRLDLVTGNGHVNPFIDRDVPGVTYEEPMGLFRNIGGGRFESAMDVSGAIARRRSTRGLAIGDYDNDGRPDILCVNRNASAELFRNVSQDGNHWLSLRLVGTKSNRDGAGAKVRIKVQGRVTAAESRNGSSYASSSDKKMLFGLGNADRVDELLIEWPSGTNDSFTDVPADSAYVATEGKGYVPERASD